MDRMVRRGVVGFFAFRNTPYAFKLRIRIVLTQEALQATFCNAFLPFNFDFQMVEVFQVNPSKFSSAHLYISSISVSGNRSRPNLTGIQLSAASYSTN